MSETTPLLRKYPVRNTDWESHFDQDGWDGELGGEFSIPASKQSWSNLTDPWNRPISLADFHPCPDDPQQETVGWYGLTTVDGIRVSLRIINDSI